MSIRVVVRDKGGRHNLTLCYRDPDTGREVTKSAKTRDRREAERAAGLWEQELLDFRGKDGTGWDYFRRRFEDEHLAAKGKRTKQSYSVALNTFRRLCPVDRISLVTTGLFSQFQAALLNEGKPLTTIQTYMGHMRSALNWAAYVGLLRNAPKVKVPRPGKRKWMKGRPLTIAEHRKMLRACRIRGSDAKEWQRFLELLWLSGMRLEEAVTLSWDEPPVMVDLDTGMYPQILFYADGQKSNEDEAMPMPPDLAAWLEKIKPHWRRGPVVNLVGQHGKGKLTAPAVGQIITEIGEAAGITVNAKSKWASAHDYRRSFGTRWAGKVRPMTLQKMMRHKEFTTTLKYYVGIESEDVGAELWHKKRPKKCVPGSVAKESRKRKKG